MNLIEQIEKIENEVSQDLKIESGLFLDLLAIQTNIFNNKRKIREIKTHIYLRSSLKQYLNFIGFNE